MQHNDLKKYYETVFFLKHNYNYSYTEIENMMPWERDIFVDMIRSKEEETNNA